MLMSGAKSLKGFQPTHPEFGIVVVTDLVVTVVLIPVEAEGTEVSGILAEAGAVVPVIGAGRPDQGLFTQHDLVGDLAVLEVGIAGAQTEAQAIAMPLT